MPDVNCEYTECVHNKEGRCELEEIDVNYEGVCESSEFIDKESRR